MFDKLRAHIKAKLGDLCVDTESCVYCGICEKKCKTITVDRELKKWSVNDDKCRRCGICVKKCPKGALFITKTKK